MKEQRRQYLKQWRKQNRDHIREYYRQWRRSNPDYFRKYYGSKRGCNPNLSSNCNNGRKFEMLALSILKGSKDCNRECFSGKWDLIWRGKKVEVKSKRRNGNQYSFNLKNKTIPDLYLIFCLNENGEKIEKMYLIPTSAIETKHLSIGKNDKYATYQIDATGSI